MKKILIAALALAFVLPVAASAAEVGTSTSTTVTNTSGCLKAGSNSVEVYNGQETNVAASGQIVGSINVNGQLGSAGHPGIAGAGNLTLQADGSASVTSIGFGGTNTSWQSFSGTQNSTTVSTSSSAFTNF